MSSLHHPHSQPATVACKIWARLEHARVACTFLHVYAPICMLSRCFRDKVSASELRRKFIKSALLVGFPSLWWANWHALINQEGKKRKIRIVTHPQFKKWCNNVSYTKRSRKSKWCWRWFVATCDLSQTVRFICDLLQIMRFIRDLSQTMRFIRDLSQIMLFICDFSQLMRFICDLRHVRVRLAAFFLGVFLMQRSLKL